MFHGTHPFFRLIPRYEKIKDLRMISTEYNKLLGALIVNMPDYISLDDMRAWKAHFIDSLEEVEEQLGLLINSNLHDFESIECLKLLRKVFEEPIVIEKIKRTAFVNPPNFRKTEVISEKEAYFENFDDAYKWLQ